LPETATWNKGDEALFVNYLKSDMYFEVMRSLKVRAAAKFVVNREIRKRLVAFMLSEILGADEQVR
jgi:hypothetical protein